MHQLIKKTFLQNWPLFIGILFFIYIGYLSLFFYLERTTAFDTATFTFDLIRTKNFVTPLNRWGSIFSQIIPIIFLKNGVSLAVFLKIYSISVVLLNFVLFLIITIGLKNKKAAIIFLLTTCLSVRNTFYFSASEFAQGLSFVVLIYALLEYLVAQKLLSKQIFTSIIITLISCSLFYFNQLLIVPIVFVFIYFIIENKSYRNIGVYSCFLITILWFGVKLIMLPKNGYEKTKIPTIDVFLEQLGIFFELPSWEYLTYFFDREFYILPIIFLLGMVVLIFRQKFLLSMFILAFVTGYIILITITYYRGASEYMYEQYFIVFGFFIAFLLNSIFISLEKIKNVVVIILLLIFGCSQIYLAHTYPTKRLTYIKLLTKIGNQYPNKKFVIHPDDFPWTYAWASWAFPIETLLVSSVESNNNSLSFYVAQNSDDIKIDNYYDLLCVDWMKYLLNTNLLDTTYFKVPTDTKYLVTNRLNKCLPFVSEKIKYSRTWLDQIKIKAKESKTPLDIMIYHNAKNVVDNAIQEKKIRIFYDNFKMEEFNKIELEIMSSEDWVKSIKQKAIERNTTFEKMLKIDVQYIYETKQK